MNPLTYAAASFRRPIFLAFFAAIPLLAGCSNYSSTTNTQPVSITISPLSASVQTGGTQQFSATVLYASNTGVTWQVNGVAGGNSTAGTISAAGLYTAPAAAPSGTVTVTAVAQADTTKTSSATVTVTAPPPAITVTVSPKTPSVQVGQTQQFTATVANTSNTAVTWQVNGVTGGNSTVGMISTSGLYTAPSTVPSPASVAVKAISQADNTKSDTATATITAAPPPITVTVSPKTPSVQVGLTQQFTATVANTSNTAVTWQVNGVTGGNSTVGTISAAGLYSAPAAVPSGTVTVKAISQADNTKFDTATVTITASSSVTVTISPKRAAITTGQTQAFSAMVNGVPSTSVSWEVDTVPGGNSTTGTITAGGIYAPPTTGGVHNVVARSQANTSVTSPASAVGVTDLAGVFAYHNDNSRDGVNSQEYALTTATVTSATFGKLFSCAVDGAVYAQPLWAANVNVSGVKHNILVAATTHNTVYAFDADANPCSVIWSKSLLPSGETWVSSSDASCDDLVPDIGIVGTPVIDPLTSTIYVVSKSKNSSPTFFQRVHALDLVTGAEKFGGPTVISGSIGSASFDPLKNNQRAGLALVNGKVYISWASHCDNGPYHGWLFAYSASDLTATPDIFTPAPHATTGAESGIWMSGGAPASDSSGNIYVITGNGTFDANSSTAPNDDYGDSFLKLSTSSGISVADYFTPNNFASLQSGDTDFGAGGAAVLLDPSSGPNPHLVIGGGKEGILYLLNRDTGAMGHTSANDANAVQQLNTGGAIFSTPALWQNRLYVGAAFAWLQLYTFNTSLGTFSSSTSHSSIQYGFPGTTPSISASGATNGIVWTLETSGYCTAQSSSCSPAILHAYDALNVATELWKSSTNSADAAGNAVKFCVPTVANGKVFVGTRGNNTGGAAGSTSTPGEIDVYGLKPN